MAVTSARAFTSYGGKHKQWWIKHLSQSHKLQLHKRRITTRTNRRTLLRATIFPARAFSQCSPPALRDNISFWVRKTHFIFRACGTKTPENTSTVLLFRAREVRSAHLGSENQGLRFKWACICMHVFSVIYHCSVRVWGRLSQTMAEALSVIMWW